MSESVPNQVSTEPETQDYRLTQPMRITEQTWPAGAVPVVSICCITYNHEKFIRECFDGFLMQETTFPVEVLIHDDASTDGTADIIREYEAKYPDIIKPIYQTENQYSKGVKPNPNFNYPRARGKYIALCEGDDYWTDPLKLHKQLDFLEVNLEYVLVADNSIWHDLFNDKKRKFSELPERDLDILEMLRKRQFGTASVLFRNLGNQLFTGEVSGDTILWCHLTKYGKIRYSENVSSVYRRHDGGVTGGDKVDWAKQMIAWNNALSKNHPEINGLVFEERNLENFKDAINYLVKKSYKQALFAVDELANTTTDSLKYKEKLFEYIEEIIQKKIKERDKKLNRIYNSWSFKIGRGFTMPVRGMLKISKKLRKLIYNLTPQKIHNKRKLIKRGIIFIDKRRIIKESKNLKPLTSSRVRRSPKLIVSLTSFPQRIPEIFFTLYSLLNQTVKPDMLILWLANEQFPNKEKDLPKRVLNLQKFGLAIRWCSDIKSYKKLLPSLKKYPNDIIVTADDDIFYAENWLELLHKSYLRETNYIHCHRAHRIVFDDDGELAKYHRWPKGISTKDASFLNFCTGCGGVLYPPGSLYSDTSNAELFMRLCPTADDIWFWAMAVLNNTKIRVVDNNITEPQLIHIDPEVAYGLKEGNGLFSINKSANDQQLKDVIVFYEKENSIKNRLKNEFYRENSSSFLTESPRS